MPAKNKAITVTYVAVNAAGVRVTEDPANHTLRGIRDGVAFVPTASSTAVAGCRGCYSLALTAAENNGDLLTLVGESSTEGVEIVALQWANECNLNTAQLPVIAAEVLDTVVEGTFTLREMSRISFAVLAGACTGAGTAEIRFLSLDGNTTRLSATVDTAGNRSNIQRNGG